MLRAHCSTAAGADLDYCLSRANARDACATPEQQAPETAVCRRGQRRAASNSQSAPFDDNNRLVSLMCFAAHRVWLLSYSEGAVGAGALIHAGDEAAAPTIVCPGNRGRR
jgi:hypothetical protein